MPKPKVFNTETVYTVNYNGVEIGPVYEDLKSLQEAHDDLFPSYTNMYHALHRRGHEAYKKGGAVVRKRGVVRSLDRKEVEV
jgi:hypothetical protein